MKNLKLFLLSFVLLQSLFVSAVTVTPSNYQSVLTNIESNTTYEFVSGTYTMSLSLISSWRSGSKSNVTFTRSGSGEVIIRLPNSQSLSDELNRVEFKNWSDLTLEHMTFKNLAPAFEDCINSTMNNLIVRDQHFTGNVEKKSGNFAIYLIDGTNCTIKNCTVIGAGEDNGDDMKGIKVGGGTYHKLINNTIKGVLKMGIAITATSPPRTYHIVDGGLIDRTGGREDYQDHGIYILNVSDVEVKNVTVKGWSDTSAGQSIKIKGANYVNIHHNDFHTSGLIIRVSNNWTDANEHIWIHHNTFHDGSIGSWTNLSNATIKESCRIEYNSILNPGGNPPVKARVESASKFNAANALANNQPGGVFNNCISGSLDLASGINASGNSSNVSGCGNTGGGGNGGGGNGGTSYCASNGNNTSDEYIGRVQLGSIDNSTGASGGGYGDHTSLSTDLNQNASYTITITPSWTGTVYSEGYAVWIDYNKDGDFSDSGEQVWTQSPTQNTPVSGTFTVPSTASTGASRMRVSLKYNGIPTPCESFQYGEVEDYTVNIGSGNPCNPSTLTPYLQVNNGAWQQSTSVTLNVGDNLRFGPQPTDEDAWNWSGPNGFTSSLREATVNNIQTNQSGNYVATYTNPCGATSDLTFSVTVNGGDSGAPYCSSNGNNTADEYIGRIQLGSIDNATGASAGGYGDYTSLSTNLNQNASNTITITPAWTGTVYNEGYSVWIDYNQDGDFSDSGEQVWTQSPTQSTPVSGTFTVPSTALVGATRMRVSLKYDGIPTPCESFQYGEVEDYTVNISSSGGTYCNPIHAGDEYDLITNVSLNTINNSSGGWTSGTGYSDFTNISTGLNVNTTYTISVSTNFGWPDSKLGIWIDWNGNYQFDNGEEIASISGNGPYSETFTVPSNATLGSTRLRIRLQYGPSYTPDPCAASSYNSGETEDYTVNVTNNSSLVVTTSEAGAGSTYLTHSTPKANPINNRMKATEFHPPKRQMQVIDLSIYPNPSQDWIMVKTDLSEDRSVEVIISDLKGNIIFKRNDVKVFENGLETKIEISHLQDGVYFLTILNGDVKTSERFIKKGN